MNQEIAMNVYLQMDFQIRQAGKFRATEVTLIFFDSSMRYHVLGKLTAASKLLIADMASA